MYEPTPAVRAFVALVDELNKCRVSLRIVPGGYRVAVAGASETEAFYTDDLAEAEEKGRDLGGLSTPPPPPLGPTGRRSSRKGLMYRHNAMIAAMRRKAGIGTT